MTKPTSYRYWAFISYSNKDKAWARWLHKAIENYGIPARLVSHPTPTGDPAPKRFRPLFHDRAELPASADLGADIKTALQASRYLIVICSPHAAQSPWVNKEVKTFIGLGRRNRVLAVIVDGEPGAGGDRECFPAGLRQAEPIAADVRPEGDGRTNAKLKLLAGMLGVGFDGLKQRDVRRRIRRLQIAAGFSLMLAMGFAGLALYAQRQRDKAVMARRQAESMLEYLLFDLRDKLAPVGRLDIVRDVQEKVDGYFREFGIEKREPGTLRNQAVAFVNKGSRLFLEGDLEGALREFRAGLQIAGQLVTTDPSNALWQRDLSVIQDGIGDVLRDQGDLAGSLKAYRESLGIREHLAAADPSNALWQSDLSGSYGKVGHMLLAQGDLSGALKAYRESLGVAERLAAADATNAGRQWHLSGRQASIGDVLLAQGDLAGALQAYREGQAILQRLAAADPTNAGWQWDLSVSHSKVGGVLLAQGDLAGALNVNRESLGVAERLAAADPSNAGWQRDLSVIHSNVGDVLLEQGDLAGALIAKRESLGIIERLVAADPTNLRWQGDLSVSHIKVGEVLLAQGDLASALKAYREGQAILQRLAAADPTNAGWQRYLALSYWRMADIAEKAGQGDARAWWRKAYDQLSGMKQRGIMQPADEQYLEQLRRNSGG